MQLSTVLRIHAVFVWLLAAHWSAEAAEMHQRSHVNIPGGIVRLGDVVTTRGGEPRQVDPLLKLELCPAPSPDKSLRIDRRELTQLLILNEVDIRTWKFSGAEETIVMNPKAGGIATVSANAETTRMKKDAEGAAAKTAELPAVRVVCALRPIDKGDILKASDFELVPAKDDRTVARAFQDIDELVGKQAKRLIPAGYAVDASYVQPPQLVKKNEQVTVRAKAAGVTVTVRGTVKDDGAAGDVVPVIPEGSKETIMARVTGLRELEVFASGPRY